MATKERIHQLVDAMPDGPETDLQLDDIEHKLEQPTKSPRIESLSREGGEGALSEDDAMLIGHEAAIERLRADPVQWASWQAEIAELDGTLADGLSGL
jgi:hypothetical protein